MPPCPDFSRVLLVLIYKYVKPSFFQAATLKKTWQNFRQHPRKIRVQIKRANVMFWHEPYTNTSVSSLIRMAIRQHLMILRLLHHVSCAWEQAYVVGVIYLPVREIQSLEEFEKLFGRLIEP